MARKASGHVDEIIDLRIKGETLESIGNRYEVSRQRIDQLLSRSDKYQETIKRPDDFPDHIVSADFLILDRGYMNSNCHIWRWNPGKVPKLNGIDVRILVYSAQKQVSEQDIIFSSRRHRVRSLCGQIRCCTLSHFEVIY